MKLKIQNTLSRKKEEFIPIDPKNIRVYSCGPTVYSTPHIGNLRAAFFADILRNTLQNILGYNLIHVMNITDVGHLTSDADDGEDKMEKGAKKEGLTARDVAKKYEKIFMDSLSKLNIEPFSVMPRATEHIQDQIDLVSLIEKNGYTYKIPGDGIYMDTSKIDDYGKLMGPNFKKHLEGLKSGARIEDSGKRNPTDFALRKFSPEGSNRDMERDSPWGKGFPGRHIECSAMSSKYLGKQFDIHTGGVEHIPIHHTDEIAQTECAFGKKPRVKYRMHNQHLQVDGGKMSKSLGNIYNLNQLEEKGFSALDLRYFFLTANYSNFQNFTRELLESAKKGRQNMIKHLKNCNIEKSEKTLSEIENIIPNADGTELEKYKYECYNAVLDNLDTPKLLGIVHKYINSFKQNNGSNYDLCKIIYFLDKNLLKLGLFEEENKKEGFIIPEQIKKLAENRLLAKQNKDYQKADEIRLEITKLGFSIKDEKDSYIIEKI